MLVHFPSVSLDRLLALRSGGTGSRQAPAAGTAASRFPPARNLLYNPAFPSDCLHGDNTDFLALHTSCVSASWACCNPSSQPSRRGWTSQHRHSRGSRALSDSQRGSLTTHLNFPPRTQVKHEGSGCSYSQSKLLPRLSNWHLPKRGKN